MLWSTSTRLVSCIEISSPATSCSTANAKSRSVTLDFRELCSQFTLINLWWLNSLLLGGTGLRKFCWVVRLTQPKAICGVLDVWSMSCTVEGRCFLGTVLSTRSLKSWNSEAAQQSKIFSLWRPRKLRKSFLFFKWNGNLLATTTMISRSTKSSPFWIVFCSIILTKDGVLMSCSNLTFSRSSETQTVRNMLKVT